MNTNPIFQLLRADGSITVNKALIHAIGHNEAVIYSELLSRYFYFEEKQMLGENNTFYNSINDLFLGTGIHDKSQRTAIEHLGKYGLLDVVIAGIPKKRYFKLNFDIEIISKLLEIGKLNMATLKEEMDIKTNDKLSNIPIVPKGNIEKSIGNLLIMPKDRINNTKPNNTNKNKTNILHHLSEDDGTYIGFYLQVMDYCGLKHKRVNDDNYNLIIETITDLIEEGLEEEYWQDAVKEHFVNLSDGNDGDILCFLTAKSRYFPEYSQLAY